MYPFTLFVKAANGEPLTPWERSQYKLWQVLGTAVTAFLLVNLPTIQQLLTDPGSTDIWYTVRAQLLVPLLMAVLLAFLKYQGAQTDVAPLPGQSLKLRARKMRASTGVNDVKTPIASAAPFSIDIPATPPASPSVATSDAAAPQ